MKIDPLRQKIYDSLPGFAQNTLVSHFGNIRWKHESSDAFQQIVSSLLVSQYYPADVIRGIQEERLTEVLSAAKSTAYYSGILPSLSKISEEPFSVLRSIPVLSKETLRKDRDRFKNDNFRERLIQHGTSGTTGTPLQTVWTKKCIDMERALIWRQRKVTGLDFGRVWRGMLGGSKIVPPGRATPPYWRVNRRAKQIYFSTYHLTSKTGLSYLSALKKYNIRALEGYPSVLFALAHILDKNGITWPLDSIYYGAEPLQDYQRELLEKVFQCYVWDYYGLTERVASASEFECRNGLHENWENCILEVVDPQGNPVPDGEYGELIGTSLSNLGFPLLRYRTGDMTRFLPGDCTCGRSSRRIARIDTKREDLLLMPDGSLLSASNLTFPFKDVSNILESQLYQNSTELLTVRIIPSSEYSESDGNKLLRGLREMVPQAVTVKLEIVRDIPRTESGKFRFCISELTGKWN